jgi:hypothetical protein
MRELRRGLKDDEGGENTKTAKSDNSDNSDKTPEKE